MRPGQKGPGKPRKHPGNQLLILNLHTGPAHQPRRVPGLESILLAPMSKKSRVTFQGEFFKRTCRARTKAMPGLHFGSVGKPAAPRAHLASKASRHSRVLILDGPKRA